jgi:uncharacterized membrane protein YgcG
MPDAMERLRDFSAALRQGHTQAALAAARDACLAEPNMAEAHYAFGQAWIAAGAPARAEQAFAVAIRLRPNFGAMATEVVFLQAGVQFEIVGGGMGQNSSLAGGCGGAAGGTKGNGGSGGNGPDGGGGGGGYGGGGGGSFVDPAATVVAKTAATQTAAT